MQQSSDSIARAASAIASADALLISAGAGMGVDSGLPDFRGDRGFWKAYPPYEKLGLRFVELANPRWFENDATFAWGFYGHRHQLYCDTTPHEGFQILRSWADRVAGGAFVYTSNVDGHFQKAGFAESHILEVHGSVHWLQCSENADHGLFATEGLRFHVDPSTMRAAGQLPQCPECLALARPNILMFNDWGWNPSRSDEQSARLEHWFTTLPGRLVVVECGAGTAVPTVRLFCEKVASRYAAPLIRINVREPETPPGQISLPLSALDALRTINYHLEKRIADR